MGAAEKYNDIIAYETLRVAVCETMESYSTQYPTMLTYVSQMKKTSFYLKASRDQRKFSQSRFTIVEITVGI